MLGPESIVYGDKVINVANLTKEAWPKDERARNYVANGEIGIACASYSTTKPNDFLHVEFSTQKDHNYSYDKKDFDEENGTANLELAYALTVHKAQGSQFKTVILVLAEPCRIISREMLYTALTRQMKNIVILYNQDTYHLMNYASAMNSDMDRLLWGVKTLIILLSSPVKYKKFFSFLKSCNDIMETYIIAELVEALLVGSVNFIFMVIFGMPYAILVSVVVGITNMIPTFGPIFGAAVGGLILLLADPWKALAFLIFTVILQTLDGYVLKPKMYGDALGVSSVMILIFIIVGGKMFGVVGILVAIPLAAIISIVYNKFQTILLEKKAMKLGIDKEELQDTQ